MSKNLSLLALFLLLPAQLLADITVPLPGVPHKLESPIEESKADPLSSAFVSGTEREDEKVETTDGSVHLLGAEEEDAGLDKEITIREELKNYGVSIPHSREGGESYQRLTDKDLLYRFQGEGSHGFSFYYIRDEYDVSDTNGIYDRTYGENVPKAMRGGSLHFSFEKYWIHNKVFVGWGMNFGVGLAQGQGSFTSGGVAAEQSATTFSLWTLPVDVALVFEVPLGNWLKIGISGGPSAMGLYQHRDDKDNREGGKHLRQVSWGYFARANLKISMSHIMPSQAIYNMKAYNMTKTYLTLEARVQDFSNFQDDVSISGSSFGLGFAFEYL